MASIGESAGPRSGNRGEATGFVWVSSSPSPAEVAALEDCFPDVVRIDSTTLEEASLGWKEQAILARTFQRWVPPDAFLREFRRAGVPGTIQPLSLAHRCHIFRFEDPTAKNLVLGRPWVINGQPVAIEAWRPEFVPSAVAVSSALLWVRLPSLPVEFWKAEVLKEIVEPAGDFLFADSATQQLSRGGFARVCVRVDLRRPLRPGVRIQGVGNPFWQQFQFENLDGICPLCGSIHLSGPCTLSSSSPAAEQPPAGPCFGAWMCASRRRRPLHQEQRIPLRHPGSSQVNSVPPAATSQKPASQSDPPSDGWSFPAKVSRRKSLKGAQSISGQGPAPVFVSAGLHMESGALGEEDSSNQGVPVGEARAGLITQGVTEGSNVQTVNVQTVISENQVAVAPGVKSTNPFAILGAGKWDGPSLARSDANPGPSKRARPVESLPMRSPAIRDNRKGKSTSKSKVAKGKSRKQANNQGRLERLGR